MPYNENEAQQKELEILLLKEKAFTLLKNNIVNQINQTEYLRESKGTKAIIQEQYKHNLVLTEKLIEENDKQINALL